MIPRRAPSDNARLAAWGITWLAYATYYVGRKGLSVAKKPLETELGIDRNALAAIDTGYLVAYSAGQFLSGLAADSVGARRVVGGGLLCSALCCTAFGLSSTALMFALLFGLNGLAQSAGWPGTTRAMAEWTTGVDRRRVMAIWSTCYQVGGLAATAGAAWLLSYGWRSIFFVPAVAMGAVGVLVLTGLRPGPGAPGRDSANGVDADDLTERRAARRAVLRSPLLWCIGASYFSMKLIRYSLLFWLPYYLVDDLGYAPGAAGYLSTAFEFGGIVGVVGTGLMSHRLRHVSRPLLASITLVGLAAMLLGYQWLAGLGPVPCALGLALVGVFLFGPDSVLSGTAAQDAGGKHAAATATGFVNCIGSLGAILQGGINAWVSQTFGWQAVFYVLIGFALLAALVLVPAYSRDVTPA